MLKRSGLFVIAASICVLVLVSWTHSLQAAQDFVGEWISPYPQGNTLNDVWGASGTDVFAVGDVGAIVHYDGTTWTVVASGTEANLLGVGGTTGSDVFAVGQKGTILHYDGVAWAAMDSPTLADLAAVWAASPSDVFAVGSGGTILHYDGLSWSVMDVSDLYAEYEDINFLSVWGLAGDEVYVELRDGWCAAEQVPGVRAVEKLWVRKTGLEYFTDIHIEVDEQLSVAEGHRIGHRVKDRLLAGFPALRDVLVHLEPFPNAAEPRVGER